MDEMAEPILIYSTFGDRANAEAVARMIVEQRLGACVNLLPGVKSYFFWEGQMQVDDEIVLLVKSVKEQEAALINFITAHHGYQEPAVMVLPISGGAAGVLEWDRGQVG